MRKIPKIGKTKPSNVSAELGWMNAIYSLSGGEFTRRNEVLLAPIDESLMWLVMENWRAFDEATTYKAQGK